ncbi:hypothetical protein RyT2_24210 [Pseudolactococcus yaeyamensis]
MTNQIKNAKIVSTHLGYEEHGIFTAYIRFEGAGWGVVMGGEVLDKPTDKGRVLGRRGAALIPEILKVVGVDTWEDLPGKYVRVEDEDLGNKVTKFGHLMDDIWLDFDSFFKQKNEGD